MPNSFPNDAMAGFVDYKPETHVESWKNLSQDELEKIPAKDRSLIKQLVERYSRSELAHSRITDLHQIAKRPTSSSIKLAVRLCATLLSALTFSAGMQVLTARLGRMGTPAALLAAAAAGYLVENRGSKAITRLRQRHSTLKTRKALECYRQENPPTNELQHKTIQTRFDLLQQVEAESLASHFPVDSALAGGLSLAEYATAFWIAVQLGLPGGALIAAVTGSLPIAILWIAAAFQSDSFELPDCYGELIEKYRTHLLHPEHFSAAEVKALYCLDDRLRFIVEGDSSGRIKNLGMATAAFEICYHRKQRHYFVQELIRVSGTRLDQHRDTVAQLSEQFSLPVGLSEEEWHWERTQWVKQETQHLKTLLSEDMELIRQKYSQQIKNCDEEISNAEKVLKQAYQHWLNRRGYSEKLLSD